MISRVVSGIVRILGKDGQTVGTGFVISPEGLIATCAHVVRQAGAGPGDLIQVAFYGGYQDGLQQPSPHPAKVEPMWWREPHQEDVAVLRLEPSGDAEESRARLPSRVGPLTLGSSFGAEGRTFNTFGFPAAKPVEGLPGKCEVIGGVTEDGHPVLALRSNEISYGFSGAPVWDSKTQAVIGMVVSTIPASFDPAGKQSEVSFLIPSETLRRVCEPVALVERCPYRGLEAFEAGHEADYYGRDGVVEDMIGLLSKHNFVSVVGVSGSGKSSLVRAGLAKGLRHWEVPVLAPRRRCVFNLGNTPFI
jgi:S1-C subfamily serine protease